MQVTVKFFASLRDRAGTDHVNLPLPEQTTVAGLLNELATQIPALAQSLPTVIVAVNQEFAFAADSIHEGDEIVLFPPVSGGAGSQHLPEYLDVTSDLLDIGQIVSAITTPETGAVCVFSGAVRGRTSVGDGSAETDRLIYEAYLPMAKDKIKQVALEIRDQFPRVQGIGIVQRVGELSVGETTILVACSSSHRTAGCFEAARYGIDRVKEIVPVWKMEVGPDRQEWVDGHYHPTPQDIKSTSTPSHGKPSSESEWTVTCNKCGTEHRLSISRERCDCGGLFNVASGPRFDPARIDSTQRSMWRYKEIVSPPHVETLTLGEGWTPLVPMELSGRPVLLKMESLNPTGSFKDRGAALLTAWLKSNGVTQIHDDSSGNAGSALAAYAAHAGIQASLFVPASASAVKLAQIVLYGARLETVEGPRSAATHKAESVDPAVSLYASHVRNPISILAYRTIAYEIWEQLNRQVPDVVVLPVGQGTQLLGIRQGFDDIRQAGFAFSVPRLVGVQAENCAPIWRQAVQSDRSLSTNAETSTLAEGIRIDLPERANEVIRAVTETGGELVTVSEDEILFGFRELARRGVLVEPTSAVVVVGHAKVVDRLPASAVVVICITGSGHKTPNLDKLVLTNAPALAT